MDPSVERLRTLARNVARAQDRRLRAHPLDVSAARQRLQALHREPGTAIRPLRRRLWVGLAAAAVALGALVVFWPASRGPMRFEIGPSELAKGEPSHPGSVGDRVAAPANALLPLTFSDGSVIRLEAGAAARVVGVTPVGARVVLERGSAHARVVHGDDSQWNITAGPFEVRVVGTTFEVGWEPSPGVFTLSLEQGRVAVSGCDMPRERMVASGETFRATCLRGRVDIEADAAPLTAPKATGSGGDAASGGRPTPADPESTRSALEPRIAADPESARSAPEPMPTRALRRGPRWEDLADSDRYEEAVDAAEAEGLPLICSTSDASKLMKLADAARLAKRTRAASDVLQSVRERFGNDPRASVAAFYLGRIAFDRGAYGVALRWFDTVLTERPDGPLAREAAGRVIEALEQSGDSAGAREAAKRYLAVFPNGPHAALARSLSGP